MFGTAAFADDGKSAAPSAIEADGVPDGFADLARERDLLVDVYFGGRKIGEARIMARSGYVRFKEPGRILALVPNIDIAPELSAAVAGNLKSNARLVCSDGTTKGCGLLEPAIAGVIFDEDRFRLDLFVNRKWLRLIRPDEDVYLPAPTAPLSLTSSMGFALSGSSETAPVYNLQNRTIVAFHDARIRSDSSYASKFGLLVDTLVGEIDRPGVRYSGGLFWAPGVDLTGQRRILGLGAATQFDTRTDRDSVRGTPLILFLDQPARVDVMIDGRLLDSRSYEAGNNILDTSNLPDGSYSLLLRIHEAGGAVREERRFFARNADIAPVGQPIYFAYAGILANSRPGRPISLSSDLFYQFGTARRLNDKVALDLTVIGTGRRPVLEAGTWLMSSLGRLRVAGLVSAAGDHGALVQLSSGNTGRLAFNFDLRWIWSHDGKPVIPLSRRVDTFNAVPLEGAELGSGSYTQASGSIGYRLGAAYLALIGSLRKDEGSPADYSVGPNLNWPLVSTNGLQVALQADAQLTRTATAGYLGVRLFFNSGGYSVSSTAGRRGISSRDEAAASRTRAVGDTTAHFSTSREDGTDLSLAAGLSRELESTAGHAQGSLYSRFGNLRGEVRHDFEGDRRTQYGLTLQTAAVANRDDFVIGGRALAESALLVSVDGTRGQSEFDILVDNQPRGRVRSGGSLSIFLQPYQAYSVRLRPVDAASVWFDSAAREFTLYPGNVEHLRWTVEHLVTVFGRAVRPDGTPVADATITSRRGIGRSDSNGYFQIEVSDNGSLAFASKESACTVTVAGSNPGSDYIPLGKVVCR
ncbi:MAG TPA: CS1-pili formation C-terminal domain-containing protein [Sphingomicrobium sp.]|nr:CS1-pili formation C-terminal domain-containing protein [Sphingomicrobium sp.]